MSQAISSANSTAPSENFIHSGEADGEKNPSSNPAITSSGTVPASRRTLSAPASARAWRRLSKPGATRPRARRSPAAPARMIEGSSSEPCGATKLHSFALMPACAQAVPMTPINTPFQPIIYSVPSPAVTPRAKVAKVTPRLLVIMPLEAAGAIEVIDSVHICRCSMVRTISGPSNCFMKGGRARVSSAPNNAPARNKNNDASE